MHLSVADELKKLDQLRLEGLLTEEEFAQQKAKLLDGHSGQSPNPASPSQGVNDFVVHRLTRIAGSILVLIACYSSSWVVRGERAGAGLWRVLKFRNGRWEWLFKKDTIGIAIAGIILISVSIHTIALINTWKRPAPEDHGKSSLVIVPLVCSALYLGVLSYTGMLGKTTSLGYSFFIFVAGWAAIGISLRTAGKQQ